MVEADGQTVVGEIAADPQHLVGATAGHEALHDPPADRGGLDQSLEPGGPGRGEKQGTEHAPSVTSAPGADPRERYRFARAELDRVSPTCPIGSGAATVVG
ncbi:hypothetical protein GCM10009828_026390 [Actinoplanes couchii]|uniref:Uncharacterized protein n=1 Tax=Actinoplanes couchii TaxID=403638 RepID=A0ABQ3XA64_9ACTN|nr:hypothetical protein Aco03nite_037830 [Actinoplanes couchii]